LIHLNFTNNKDAKVDSLSIVSLFFLLLYLNPCSVCNFLSKLISLVYIKLAINATLANTHITHHTILKLLIYALITTSFIAPSSLISLHAFMTYTNELASRDHLSINVEYAVARIFFFKTF
jgi:hypothetical protein